MSVESWTASRTIGEQGASVAAWLALAAARPEQRTSEDMDSSHVLEGDCSETAKAALFSLRGDLMNIRVLTMSELARGSSQDALLSGVMTAVGSGTWPQGLEEFKRVAGSLTVADGVLLYGDRVVVPESLKPEVLATLHGGHQGVSSMMGRAGQAVWWPGLSADITHVRDRCLECNRNAPSQQKEPPAPLPEVQYPFQMVCSDYMDVRGQGYLVLVDRYSGWPIVHDAKKATARELVRAVQEVCTTFGVPEELSSDGGPQFMSSGLKEFCRLWGIR